MIQKLWTKAAIRQVIPADLGGGVPDSIKVQYWLELTTDNPERDGSVEILAADTQEELFPYLEAIQQALGLEPNTTHE
jgi:hypothetical protein